MKMFWWFLVDGYAFTDVKCDGDLDYDLDGVPDSEDVDDDNDGVPDALDTDDDNTGIPDHLEDADGDDEELPDKDTDGISSLQFYFTYS